MAIQIQPATYFLCRWCWYGNTHPWSRENREHFILKKKTKQTTQRHKISSVLNNCKRLHNAEVTQFITGMSSQPQLRDLYQNQDEASCHSLESHSPGLTGYNLTQTVRTLLSTSSHELQQCPTCWNQPQSQSEHQSCSSTWERAEPGTVQGSTGSGVGWAGHSPALCPCEMGLCASPTASPAGDTHPLCTGTASRSLFFKIR